jgi:hypothetical protein
MALVSGSQGRKVRGFGGLAVPDADLPARAELRQLVRPGGWHIHGGHGHTGGHTRRVRARSAPTGVGHFAAANCRVPASVPESRLARTAKLVEDTALSVEAAVFAESPREVASSEGFYWIANSFSDLYLRSTVRWPRG